VFFDGTEAKPSAAVIGLGSMGYGMANSLVCRGHRVVGYDPSPAAVTKLVAAGGATGNSPQETAQGARVVLCVVLNSTHTQAALFAQRGAFAVMTPASVFVSSGTMAPSDAKRFAAHQFAGAAAERKHDQQATRRTPWARILKARLL
jgi:L-threonate 2-dehydrogenase